MIVRFFNWLFGTHEHNWGSWEEKSYLIRLLPDGTTGKVGIVQARKCHNCGLQEFKSDLF